MPTDYNNRPTNQQLVGMTPQEILGIMGGADKYYESFIPQYNRKRENLARTNTQFSLKNVSIGSQQAQAKSGFAGSGAIGQSVGRAREGTLQGFQKQLEGFRSQYASDVYGSLGTLANLGVFKKEKEKDPGPEPTPVSLDPTDSNYDPNTAGSSVDDSGVNYNSLSQEDFPTEPTEGQQWTDSNGVTWEFTGYSGWQTV